MASQDNIININEEESISTDITAYFLGISLVADFADTDLNDGVLFSTDGYQEYTSYDGVLATFPSTHKVAKYAKGIFDQKTNTGVNKSAVQKVTVIQKLASDASFEIALDRVGYKNTWAYVACSNDSADIESLQSWISGRRKKLFAQTSDEDVITSADTCIASTLADKGYNTALFYHSEDVEGLAGAIASIMTNSKVGSKGGFYKTPTGITVGSYSEPEEGYLDSKNVNYYTTFLGGAGDYSSRKLTANGVCVDGDKIQKDLQIDRTVLNIQTATMDSLIQDLPYDDGGGTVLYGYIEDVLKQLKSDTVIAQDSTDDAGDTIKGFEIEVLTIAEIKNQYSTYYENQKFVVFITVNFALTAEKVEIGLAY